MANLKTRKNSNALPNVYENAQEANMRLAKTVVKYRNDFYRIHCVAPSKLDSNLRVYMEKLNRDFRIQSLDTSKQSIPSTPQELGTQSWDKLAEHLDKYMEEHPSTTLVRKLANSKYFNRFRPFPCGMLNSQHGAFHLERQPMRSVLQGLTVKSIETVDVDSLIVPPSNKKASNRLGGGGGFHPSSSLTSSLLFSASGYEMLHGIYPDFDSCYKMIHSLGSKVMTSAAFDRKFAIVKGPLDTTILCMGPKAVGFVSQDRKVKLTKNTSQYLEEIQESGLFSTVEVSA